jgi:hypothetical protein
MYMLDPADGDARCIADELAIPTQPKGAVASAMLRTPTPTTLMFSELRQTKQMHSLRYNTGSTELWRPGVRTFEIAQTH